PVIQHIEKAAGFIPHGEPVSAKLAKISSLFEDAISDDPKVLELFAELLLLPHDIETGLAALSAAQRRKLTIAVLVDQVVRLSRDDRVLIILEDAHWIDPSSLELLHDLTRRAAQDPVFIVLTMRHGRELLLPCAPTELVLTRLSDADIEAIAINMKGAAELSNRDLATIVAKVDGIPLFAEELTSTLIEHKTDDRRLEIPENIQA